MKYDYEKFSNYQITADDLIEQLKPAIKDLFVAKVRKNSDGLLLKFSNNQSFTIGIWENKQY